MYLSPVDVLSRTSWEGIETLADSIFFSVEDVILKYCCEPKLAPPKKNKTHKKKTTTTKKRKEKEYPLKEAIKSCHCIRKISMQRRTWEGKRKYNLQWIASSTVSKQVGLFLIIAFILGSASMAVPSTTSITTKPTIFNTFLEHTCVAMAPPILHGESLLVDIHWIRPVTNEYHWGILKENRSNVNDVLYKNFRWEIVIVSSSCIACHELSKNEPKKNNKIVVYHGLWDSLPLL